MGATRDDFIKYPRTPHLFGSKGTDDDKHLGRRESEAFIADPSLIVEEKIDGTNVGIHFTTRGRMVLQCRGHEITEGMYPQYDLFKQWTSVNRPVLEAMLGSRFILYGEWMYAKHSVHYRALPHYFFEFDLYDKDAAQFLDLATRLRMLDGTVGARNGRLRAGRAVARRRRCVDAHAHGVRRNRPPHVARTGVRPRHARGNRRTRPLPRTPAVSAGEQLRAGRDFAFNATNITRQMRGRWIELFADYNARVEVIYLEPQLRTILIQNLRRTNPVPEKVIKRLLERLEPPTITECHALTIAELATP